MVPDWLKKGQTVLIQKDKAKVNIASNYRPITCLVGEIYDYLEENVITKGREGDKWSIIYQQNDASGGANENEKPSSRMDWL